jgi:hypothetical protein
MTKAQLILKARRTWNAAAQLSRTLPEEQALEELYGAAAAIRNLLAPQVEVVLDNDDDVEAGGGEGDVRNEWSDEV